MKAFCLRALSPARAQVKLSSAASVRSYFTSIGRFAGCASSSANILPARAPLEHEDYAADQHGPDPEHYQNHLEHRITACSVKVAQYQTGRFSRNPYLGGCKPGEVN